MLDLGIHLGTNQERQAGDVEPQEENDHGTDRL